MKRFGTNLSETYSYFAGRTGCIYDYEGNVSIADGDMGLFDKLVVGTVFRAAADILAMLGDATSCSAFVLLSNAVGLIDYIVRNIFAVAATFAVSPIVLAVSACDDRPYRP